MFDILYDFTLYSFLLSKNCTLIYSFFFFGISGQIMHVSISERKKRRSWIKFLVQENMMPELDHLALMEQVNSITKISSKRNFFAFLFHLCFYTTYRKKYIYTFILISKMEFLKFF